jgi:YD repeat-containing protein
LSEHASVDEYVGRPSVTIPIYTINIGNINYPISLNYSSSGVKVSEIGSWVGLGWTINAGGSISRNVFGIPNELPYGYFHFTEVINDNGIAYFNSLDNVDKHKVAYGQKSFEPDFYTFNTGNGVSGSFVEKNWNDFYLIPGGDVKINRKDMDWWELFDPKGFIYYFGKGSSIENAVGEQTTHNTHSLGGEITFTSSWMLRKIYTPDQQTSLEFKYHDDVINKTTNQELIQTKSIAYSGTFGNTCHKDVTQTVSATEFSTVFLKSIESDLVKVEFNLGYIDCLIVLDNIKIYDKSNDDVISKEILFTYYNDSYGCANKRIILEAIEIKGEKGEGEPLNYIFNYDRITQLPPRDSRGIDHWGYYNGQGNYGITGLIHSTEYNGQIVGTGNRDPEAYFTSIGLLNNIHLPTGGQIKFEYEPHTYKRIRNNHVDFPPDTPKIKKGGGMRVKKMSLVDISGEKIENFYEYDFDDGSSGMLNFFPNYQYSSIIVYHYCEVSYRNFTSHSNNSMATVRGSLVSYDKVKSYINNPSQAGFTLKEFYNIHDFGNTAFPFTPVFSNDWRRGFPKKIKVFDKNYTLVRQEDYDYQTYYSDNIVKGLKVGLWKDNSKNSDFSTMDSEFLLEEYQYIVSKKLLIEKSVKEFYEDGFYLETIDELEYKPFIHEKIVQMTSHVSGQHNKTVKYKYPPDYSFENITPNDENAIALKSLKDKNIWHSPIEVIVSFTNSQVNIPHLGILYQYKLFDGRPALSNIFSVLKPNNQITFVPSYINDNGNFIKDNNWWTQEIEFLSYENNYKPNAIINTKQGNLSYIWGYNKELPIAKLDNILFNEIQNELKNKIEELNNFSGDLTSSHIESLMELNQDIRNLLPDNVMITTYTYKPLVGITSSTDPRGRSVFYEYDGLNRLIRIRDHDENIIEEYQYHYAEPPSD